MANRSRLLGLPLVALCNPRFGALLLVAWVTGASALAQSPPQVTDITPTTGAVGTQVTITGSNFGGTQGGSTVTFKGLPATPTNWNDTQIVTSVPGSGVVFPEGSSFGRDATYFNPTQDFTIAFWFRLGPVPQSTTYRTLYAIGDDLNYSNPYVWVGTSLATGTDKLVFEAWDGSNFVDITTPQVLSRDQWHYAVLTHVGATHTFTGYVDGTLVGSAVFTLPAFVEKHEHLGLDASPEGVALAHLRNWSAVLPVGDWWT